MSDIRFPYKDKSIGVHNGVHRPDYLNLEKNELNFIWAEISLVSSNLNSAFTHNSFIS